MNIWEAKSSDELLSIALTTCTTEPRLRKFAEQITDFAANGDDQIVRRLMPLALAYAYAEGVAAAIKDKALV